MKVFLIGYPGEMGGANTEAWHTVKVWRRFGLEVHLIPTWSCDARWKALVDSLGCTTHAVSPDDLESINDLPGSPVVSFCNREFIAHAHRFRALGCPLVWANCMTFLFDHEKRLFAEHGPADAFVFQSEFQRAELEPQLIQLGYSENCGHLIRGAFDLDEFEFAPRSHPRGDVFVVGRMARPDLAYARRVKADGPGVASAAVVILIASSVVYVRVLIEISVVSRKFLPVAAGPILVMMALTLLPLSVVWWRGRRRGEEMPSQDNPTQLRSALVFALLYAGVLFALAAAEYLWGGEGLYAVAALSGLTDMDAITLSTSQMVSAGKLDPDIGWQLIVIATMANLAFKAALTGLLGGRKLLARTCLMFLLPIVGGVALLVGWNRLDLPW